jgi:hypothetical protein
MFPLIATPMVSDVMPFKFENLVSLIVDVNQRLRDQACHAVNLNLTLRNWMIGCR